MTELCEGYGIARDRVRVVAGTGSEGWKGGAGKIAA
jgi:hypothetical protein